MNLSRTEQAARNNAIWCDTVFRAHGVPGEFYDVLWLNRRLAPRFYPNVVTLSDQRGVIAQLAHIQDLIAAGPLGSWGIKDSFCTLDLADLGFQPLFEATWLWRAPSRTIPQSIVSGIRWTRVHSAPGLAKWEMAWSGDPANDSATQQQRLFLPSLLANQDVVFIVAYRGEEIIAGAIANRTDDVVGLSNVFVPPGEEESFWAGCVAAAHASFPGLPLVDYEHGSGLAVAQAVGFEMLRALRVWTRQG